MSAPQIQDFTHKEVSRYQCLTEKTDRHVNLLAPWQGVPTKVNPVCNENGTKENDPNKTNMTELPSIAPIPTSSAAVQYMPLDKIASAATALPPLPAPRNHPAYTLDQAKEIENIRRLDTFLNLTLDKTWDVQSLLAGKAQHVPNRQPPPQALPPVPLAHYANYQYNPKSTVTRVKGCLTWDGYLPPRNDLSNQEPEYSRKVFLGGVPWDVSEQNLDVIFSRYGDFKVEWPNNFSTKRNTTKSFLYLVFDSLTSISRLLADCSREQHGGSVTYNYHLAKDQLSPKPIQVIPWIISDNTTVYEAPDNTRFNNKLTVFVGALHGRLYAQALGHIFQELFHDVAFVQIDTDRYKYPIGSGRVAFNSIEAYRKAIEENFLTIVAPKFSKRIQIEPYIEDEPCGKCHLISAPYFCKSRYCFDYFCEPCWLWHHSIEGYRNHAPVKRNRKVEL